MTGLVDSFNVSLRTSFIRKKAFFLMKLILSETLKLSTNPVLPVMSLFNHFSTGSVCIYSNQEREIILDN